MQLGEYRKGSKTFEGTKTHMSIEFKPFDYQQMMLDWSMDKNCFAYFASPGLGKTAVVLWMLDHWMLSAQSRGALIIGPLRVSRITHPTQIELWEHSSWMKVAHLHTEEGMQAWHDGSADVYLANPERLQTREIRGKKYPGLVQKLMKGKKTLPVDTLIIDEISQAKSPSSKRFGSLRPYLPMFKQRVGLTGTPTPNSYLDLFAQIRLLDDGERLGAFYGKYQAAFFESDFMGFKFNLRPGAKEKIDSKISDIALVMLSEDYLDVPTCTTTDIEVALPDKARKSYRTMEKELLVQLEKSEIVALNAATLMGKLLQIAGGAVYDENRGVEILHDAKLKELLKIRKKHDREPILVLTQYKHEMARVLETVEGSKQFNEKDLGAWQRGEIHTWVANCSSLSHGLDGLQKSSRIAVWMTLPWSNEKYLQTNARLVRTGQSQETIIYRILASDTADSAVVEALRNKGDTQTGLMQALKNLQLLRKTP